MRGVRVAGASTLLATDGPKPALAIEAGETIWALDSSGQHSGARVIDCRPGEPSASLTRVLTRAGEVLAPATAHLAGAGGRPVPVAEVETGPRRLETLGPGFVPSSLEPPRPLESLEGKAFVLPADCCDGPSVDAALAAACVDHEVTEAGSWIVVRVNASAPRQDAWSWHDELGLLELLTCWPEGDRRVIRTRLDDRVLRSRIAVAFVACGQPYDASWTPVYRPVECRLSRIDRMPAYTGVVALVPTTGPTLTVSLEGVTAIVSDMAYLLADGAD